MPLHLPIGSDNFAKLIEQQLDFVDKSLWIKDLIDDRATEVTVITRPRRFGKTLNLSMLHHFLSRECYGTQTAGMFDKLKIAKVDGGKYVQAHQGKYPIIFITLKSLQDASFELAYNNLEGLLARLYNEHRVLLESSALSTEQKTIFQSVLDECAERKHIDNSLQSLSQYLFQHYGVKPWLLIDEYDTPLQTAYISKSSSPTKTSYYDEMIGLLRAMMGAAFKTNPYLNRAIVTGILRIAKESLFFGVNNLRVFSMLNDHYSQYFGFTQAEVDTLLIQSDKLDKQDEIRAWYNGYQFGNTTVYNPWSIVNYLAEGCLAKPYWINTSSNSLVKELILESTEDIKAQFQLLLEGRAIEIVIDENMTFGNLRQNSAAIWTLLLMSGYLKVVSQTIHEGNVFAELAIPNWEVAHLYRQMLERWLSGPHDFQWYNRFLNYLLTGNFVEFERELQDLMERVVSSHDTANNPEAFYHGLLIGVTANLHYNKNYRISSNRESGYGRYDYLILSLDPKHPSLVVELKRVKALPTDNEIIIQTKLEQAAKEALQQIQALAYLAEAKTQSSAPILQVALAFCGKRFVLVANGLENNSEK